MFFISAKPDALLFLYFSLETFQDHIAIILAAAVSTPRRQSYPKVAFVRIIRTRIQLYNSVL